MTLDGETMDALGYAASSGSWVDGPVSHSALEWAAPMLCGSWTAREPVERKRTSIKARRAQKAASSRRRRERLRATAIDVLRDQDRRAQQKRRAKLRAADPDGYRARESAKRLERMKKRAA